MSSTILRHSIRFLILFLLQVLVLKRISLEGFLGNYVHIILYPLFILLLPLRTPKPLLLALAFLMGIVVDLFYDSPGVHAGALVLMAYCRPFVLSILEPREGYNVSYSPTQTRYGAAWFLSFSAILLFIEFLTYFSLEAFTPVYLGNILLKTLFSFIFSMIFIFIYTYLFSPQD